MGGHETPEKGAKEAHKVDKGKMIHKGAQEGNEGISYKPGPDLKQSARQTPPALRGQPRATYTAVAGHGTNMPPANFNAPARGTGTFPQVSFPGQHSLCYSSPVTPASLAQPGVYMYPSHVMRMADQMNHSTGYVTQGTFGQCYQPQVPSTQNGPIQQIYTPRHDGGAVFVHPINPIAFNAVSSTPGLVTSAQVGVAPAPGAICHQPVMMPRPGIVQPGVVQPGVFHQPAQFVTPPPGGSQPMGVGVAMAPGAFTGASSMAPDVAGVGKTAGEVALEEARFAYENKLFEPQDFKPADDDSGRFYPMRQLDGAWTNVTRATIDKLNTRWYITEAGYFYAVRLED